MPQRIGKYEIKGELGKGGFGQVYLGLDPTMNRLVALKVLTSADPDLVARFRTEAMAAGNLHHKNIVTIHEFGEDHGQFFLAMECLEGRDLQKVMAEPGALTLVDKLRIMPQIAEGLQCAHQSGIVHRDVKPSNIMLLNNGTVKVMDFGIARLTRDNSTRLTQSGFLIGTISYMAPEQLKGLEADELCDIWAFGMIFYELLTGERPFKAPDAAAAVYHILQWEPGKVSSMVPGCPEALDNVIFKLLSKDRDARYQNFEDVLFDIAPILLGLDSKQAGESVLTAENLIREGKLDQAQELIRRVLMRDPSNEEARALRQKLRTLAQRATRVRVDELRTHAEELAASQDYPGAILAIESALRIDTGNTALQARLAEFHAIAERKQKAKRLIEQARRDAELDKLTAAFHGVNEALSAEPADKEAQMLLAQIQLRLNEREAQQRLADGLAKARGLLMVKFFDQADELLNDLARQSPGSKELLELRERAHQQRESYERQQFLRSEIDGAKQAIKRGEFTAAIHKLGPLGAEPSCAQEVAELVTYAKQELAAEQRAAAIKASYSEAWSLLQAKKFTEAEAKIDGGLASFPDSQVLLSLRQTIHADRVQEERRAAIQKALDESAAFEGAGELERAESIAEEASRRYPDEARLKTARERIAVAREERARAAALENDLNQTQMMLDRGQISSATRLLEQLKSKHPGDPRVASLQRRAEAEHQRIVEQQQREAIEERKRAESERLQRELEERKRAESERLQRELEERKRTEAEQALARQRLEHLAQARIALRQGDWQSVGRALQPVLAYDPLDAEARELVAEARAEAAAAEKRQRLEEGRAEAERHLKNLGFDNAIRLLEGLQREFPDHAGVRGELQQAKDAKQRHLQRETYTAGRQQADALRKEGRFDEAVSTLQSLLAQFQGDALLQRDLNDAIAEREAHARKERYQEERDSATQLMERRQFDDAIRTVQFLLTQFPGDPGLQADLEAAAGAKQLQEHRQAVDRAVKELEKLYRKGDARGVMEQASALAPGVEDARVRELTDWAQKELARPRGSPDSQRIDRRRRMALIIVASALGVGLILILASRWGTFAPKPNGRETKATQARTVEPVIPEVTPSPVQPVIPEVNPSPVVPPPKDNPSPPLRSGKVDLKVTPNDLRFDAVAGEAPVSQTVKVEIRGSMKWSAVSSQPWLRIQPSQGMTPEEIVISANPGKLQPGVYSATASFSVDGRVASASVALNIRLTLVPPPPPSPTPPKDSVSVSPPPPEVVDCHSSNYTINGLSRGDLTWTGTLRPNEDLIIIDRQTPLIGQHLPRCAVTITSNTGDVVIKEQPQRSDGFLRVKIHNNSNSPLPDVKLHWRVN